MVTNLSQILEAGKINLTDGQDAVPPERPVKSGKRLEKKAKVNFLKFGKSLEILPRLETGPENL